MRRGSVAGGLRHVALLLYHQLAEEWHGRISAMTALTFDLVYLAIYVLGDILAYGGAFLIILAVVDSLTMIMQLLRRGDD